MRGLSYPDSKMYYHSNLKLCGAGTTIDQKIRGNIAGPLDQPQGQRFAVYLRNPENSQKFLQPLEGVRMGALSSSVSTSARAALLLCILYIGFPHLYVGFTSKRVFIALMLICGGGCLTNHDELKKQIMLENLDLLIGSRRLQLVLHLSTKT